MPGRGEDGGRSARSTMISRPRASSHVAEGRSVMRTIGSATAARRRSYGSVSPSQIASPRRKPAAPLPAVRRARRIPAAPENEDHERQNDDRRLPDRGVKRLEGRRMVRSQPEERGDPKEIDGLDDREAGRDDREFRPDPGRKGDDGRGEDDQRLDPVAAVLDAHGEPGRAQDRSRDFDGLADRPQLKGSGPGDRARERLDDGVVDWPHGDDSVEQRDRQHETEEKSPCRHRLILTPAPSDATRNPPGALTI